MMDVGRLQKFAGSITAQGKLLLHGPLMCIEGVSNIDRNSSVVAKPRELQVFLFEQSIIFSDIIGKKTQFTNPSYIYKNQIQVKYTFLVSLFSTMKHRAKSVGEIFGGIDIYIYLFSFDVAAVIGVQVNKMLMEELSENRLLLRSTDPLRPELRYIINTQTNEKFHEWKKAITGILQTQHDFLKAIISPIAYQKELTKES